MANAEATAPKNGATPPESPPASSEKLGLYKKLLAAATAAGGVEKEGTHSQGWKFARAEDVIREAQKALNGAGLIVLPTIGEVEKLREYQTSKGAYGVMVRVEMLYEVLDPETGESREFSFLGTGSDAPGDKAIYKGVTGANKYFYAGLLGIPFGSDPEEGGVGEGAQSASAPPSPPANPLDAEVVNRIGMGIGALSMTWRDISLMLGACGADNRTREQSSVGLREALERLTKDQAVKVEAHLEKLAQDRDATAPDPAEALAKEEVDALMKGFEIAEPHLTGHNSHDRLNGVLGEMGVEGFTPLKGIREQFATLTSEQATELTTRFGVLVEAAEGEGAGDGK